MAALDFNAQDVPPATERKPLPEGDYKVAIVKSENKPTKNGKGSYLELVMQVLDGEHKGRQLWERLNLNNQSDVAVQIAKETLSAICHATGVMVVQDSSQLHDRPVVASVKLRKRPDNGEMTNEVKGYKSLNEAASASKPEPVAAGGAPWSSN